MSAMNPWSKRRGVVAPVSREELQRRSEAMREALQTGGSALPADLTQQVSATEAKVAQRTSIAGSRTVAALAGATGSGKSSIFNFLVGEPISRIGARRPTTSQASAAVWGTEASAGLLDWLKVDARHQVTPHSTEDQQLDGLVLLDLPDFDSRVLAHRDEADRMLRLVDVFVWVTDPQKYADAVLHDDYIRDLASHASVTLAVLNQADRLSPQETQACVEDLQRLLEKDGLSQAKVIATSAVSQQGLGELAAELARVVQTRNAAEQRLLGDLREQARALRAHVGAGEADLSGPVDADLVTALERSAGVPVVLDAVESDYARHATLATGWPITRWVGRLRPRPMARLGLDSLVRSEDAKSMNRSTARAVTGRSSIPQATPAAKAAVEVATRRLGKRAATGLPAPWAAQVQDAATPQDHDLVDALDQAVTTAELGTRRPVWWGAVSLWQWVLALIALGGLLWLAVLMVLGWFQFQVSTPTVGIFAVPFLMLVGGVLVGLLLAALSRWLAVRAARRQRAKAQRQLRAAVTEVAHEHLLNPVQDVLDRHAATRVALERAGA